LQINFDANAFTGGSVFGYYKFGQRPIRTSQTYVGAFDNFKLLARAVSQPLSLTNDAQNVGLLVFEICSPFSQSTASLKIGDNRGNSKDYGEKRRRLAEWTFGWGLIVIGGYTWYRGLLRFIYASTHRQYILAVLVILIGVMVSTLGSWVYVMAT